MNLLDENIAESQRQLLKAWRLRVRQIGPDIGHQGMKDEDQVIPLLLSPPRPVLFTRDLGFYNRRLCHPRYGIVCFAVGVQETAHFIRRFLRRSEFDTLAKRMGKVVRVSQTKIHEWHWGMEKETALNWD